MRITTNMIYERNLYGLSQSHERLQNNYQQLQTGQRLQSSGDDPAAMSQQLNLTQEIEQFKQYNLNGQLLENSLGHNETVLSAINSAMLSAQTLVQKSHNSAFNSDDKKAIATELAGVQQQIWDLMNSKNGQGEYIFAGYQSSIQPYMQQGEQFQYQGGSGLRQIQVSPTVQIAANDIGQNLFDRAATRRTAQSASAQLQLKVVDQGDFDKFYRDQFDPAQTQHEFEVITHPGTPASYEIKDSQGKSLQSGQYQQGEALLFHGLQLKLTGAAGSRERFSLNPPKNDNILNGLGQFISALRDDNLDPALFSEKVADMTVHLTNARQNIDLGLGELGSRMNNLSQLMQANEGLATLSTQARAQVSEVDLYQVISALSKENAALNASQVSFSKLSRLTLFDYIR